MGVGPDFTDKVMSQVYEYEDRRRSSWLNIQWLVDAIAARPLAQASMVTVGAIVGFLRLLIMLRVLFYA